jgi:lysophospholipase
LTGQGASPRVIRLLANAACAIGLGSLSLNRKFKERPFATKLLTSDERRYDRNRAIAEARPNLVLGPPSARWLQQAFQTIEQVSRPDHLFSITIPTLLLAPTRDGIIPYGEQERLSRSFRAAQLVPIAGARHEVFQEKDVYRSAAMAALHAFIPGSDAEARTEPVGAGL